MALARGKYGIEYNPTPVEDDSNGIGWIVFAVAVVALVSLGWTLVARLRSTPEDSTGGPRSVAAEGDPRSVATEGEPRSVATVTPPPPPLPNAALPKRPQKLQNLLIRLEEAEKMRDVERAIWTIEEIRKLPGEPAADLDVALVKRLGTLNLTRLFVQKNPQWVTGVTVRRGDSASRIAAEHGSTFASCTRLNDGKTDRIVTGQTLYVMNHPRFRLTFHKRTRTADLWLNGKLFKRYELEGALGAQPGTYEMTFPQRALWKTLGATFKPADLAELETLVPKGASVLVAEL